MARVRRRRQAADGGHDVEAADPEGGNAHGEEGYNHTEAVGHHGAAHLEVPGQLEVFLSAAGKDAVGDGDYRNAGDQAQAHPDRASHDGIGRALENKHLHQVAALGPNGPGHSHLRPAGGR